MKDISWFASGSSVGALNHINDDDEVHEDYFGDGHVDQAIVAQDVLTQHRPALLEWALDAIALNHQYRDTVLEAAPFTASHAPASQSRESLPPADAAERRARAHGSVRGRGDGAAAAQRAGVRGGAGGAAGRGGGGGEDEEEDDDEEDDDEDDDNDEHDNEEDEDSDEGEV